MHLSPQVFIWGPSRTSWRKLRKYSLELKRGLLSSYFFCKLYFGGNHCELDACRVNQEERLSDGKLTNELKCCDNCIVYVSPKGFTLSLNEIQSDLFIFLKSLKSHSTSASKIYQRCRPKFLKVIFTTFQKFQMKWLVNFLCCVSSV